MADFKLIEQITDKRSGETQTICPVCSHTRKKKTQKCVSVSFETKTAKCNHCGEFFKKEIQQVSMKNYVLPEWNNNTSLPDNLIKWFEGRGITQKTIIENKITFSKEFFPQVGKERNSINFNYFVNGVLTNVKYRDAEKNFKLHKDAKLVMYGIDDVQEFSEVVIVEGEIDKLSLNEVGFKNVLSVPNGANLNLEYFNNSLEYLEHVTSWIIATDNDEPGQKLKAELIRRLGAENCKVIDLKDCKDVNEYLIKYGKLDLEIIINTAKELPLEGIKDIGDEWNYICDVYMNGYKKGQSIGIHEMTEFYKYRLGEIDLVTGIPNHGKTTFMMWEMMVTAVHFGWKWGIYSPENYPSGEVYNTLIEVLTGKDMTPDSLNPISEAELWGAREFIEDRFFVIEFEDEEQLVTTDMIMKKGRELIKRKGINGLLIDPWNDLYHKKEGNENERDYLMRALSQLRRFKQRNGIKLVINVHPTAEAQRRKESHTEQGDRRAVVHFTDCDGGSMWGNRMDNCRTIYRNTEDKGYYNITEIHVQKVKFQKLVGKTTPKDEPIKLLYKNNRFVSQGGFDPLDFKEVEPEHVPF